MLKIKEMSMQWAKGQSHKMPEKASQSIDQERITKIIPILNKISKSKDGWIKATEIDYHYRKSLREHKVLESAWDENGDTYHAIVGTEIPDRLMFFRD